MPYDGANAFYAAFLHRLVFTSTSALGIMHVSFTVSTPCARHYSEYLTWILSLNPHNNPMREVIFLSHPTDDNTEVLNISPKVT